MVAGKYGRVVPLVVALSRMYGRNLQRDEVKYLVVALNSKYKTLTWSYLEGEGGGGG